MIHGDCVDYMAGLEENAFDLVWIEKDKDYFDKAVERVKKHNSQLDLFIKQAEIIIIKGV